MFLQSNILCWHLMYTLLLLFHVNQCFKCKWIISCPFLTINIKHIHQEWLQRKYTLPCPLIWVNDLALLWLFLSHLLPACCLLIWVQETVIDWGCHSLRGILALHITPSFPSLLWKHCRRTRVVLKSTPHRAVISWSITQPPLSWS